MTNEQKANELATTVGSTSQYIYSLCLQMAEWKDKQFEEYFDSVLSMKFLYFLNEKEKRENTVVDKMDWKKTMREFANYIKQQE